jgi:6-methylsalicylate decarboxylase
MKRTAPSKEGVTRRGFLSGSGALLAGAVLADESLNTKSASAEPQAASFHPQRLIDIHHHFFPPYAKKLELQMHSTEPNGGLQTWTPEVSLRKMEQLGLSKSILSMSNWHGDSLSPQLLQQLCRECNDYGAKLTTDHPEQFGLFASVMTLPGIDVTLKEIDYAYGTLHADGIGMMSHYGDGLYIGDATFAPVLDELNRRKAVVFVHPREVSYKLPEPARSMAGLNIPEYLFDTTRGIISLLSTAVPETYPNIRWIFAHAGGTGPYVLSRLSLLGSRTKGFKMGDWNRLAKAMGSFYYDLTNSVRPTNVKSIMAVAPASHMIFGTDIPQGEGDHSEGDGNQFAREMSAQLLHLGLSESDLHAVAYGNAEALFPQSAKHA